MKKNIFISWSSVDQRIRPIAEGYKNWLNSIFDEKIDIFFSKELEPAKDGVKNIHAGFVDNDEETKDGSMLLAPLTASSGAERPVFYATKKKNTTLYNKYFEVCKSGFDAMGSVLWPIRK